MKRTLSPRHLTSIFWVAASLLVVGCASSASSTDQAASNTDAAQTLGDAGGVADEMDATSFLDAASDGSSFSVDSGDIAVYVDALDTTETTDSDTETYIGQFDIQQDVEDAEDVEEIPPPLPEAPGWFYQVGLMDVFLDWYGESDEFYVDLPEGTSSVFVMVRGEEKAFFTLKKVITPPPYNDSIVKGPGEAICIPCENRVVSSQTIGSFLLPNDPAIEVGGGEWTFKIRGMERTIADGAVVFPAYSGLCDVILLARSGPIADVGKLRIHLHFTGSDGLTADSALTDERVQGALTRLEQLYAPVGITIEVAGYHDALDEDGVPIPSVVYNTIGSDNELSKVFLTGQQEDISALNVFFVSSIEKDLDYEEVVGLVLGIAGGVPGPAFLGATHRSGVAIATFDLGHPVDFMGNVMAHEIAHYLGLFHSTEKDAIFHDTLVDTAEDDGANIMFWAWSPEALSLSDGQAQVMRSHPLILPLDAP